MSISGRKQSVYLTSLIATIFLGGIVLFFFRNGKRKFYVPGELVKGVTAVLLRPVPKNHPDVVFTDVTKIAGIHFKHFSGQRTTQLPEDMGSGAAWIDYDQDGYEDLFVVNEAGPLTMTPSQVNKSPAHCELYHNNGNGTFTDVTKKAGINFKGWGMGVAVGDMDNDGYPDIFITAYGKNVFYHNNGNGTFTDETKKAGLGGKEGFWTGASWGDYDRDGYLDLYVCGYVKYGKSNKHSVYSRENNEEPPDINPLSFPPQRNLLYHNNRNGTFTEVAIPAGVADPSGKSLSASWCDFNNDGWPDLYVANDVGSNCLYLNKGNGTFVNVSNLAHVSDYRSSMGLAVGDWDNEGEMDLFVTHWLAEENGFYINKLNTMGKMAGGRMPLQFEDEADKYGLGQISLDDVGWGTSFFDYDNDTRLDLFVVNGSTNQKADNSKQLVPMKNFLFWNEGPKKGFADVTSVSGEALSFKNVGRGAAFGDYDNDGDVDIFIVNNGGEGELLRNDGGNKNNWLEVKLVGTKSNRSAIGAKIKIISGNVSQIQEVNDQSSYLSQNSLIQHFGLAKFKRVDTLNIQWPSGFNQQFHNIPVNERIEITEGEEKIKNMDKLHSR
ncbi:MAG TPA: CRTAC1 family protein [Chitinophagaceae bacterium]|nr:CRTAC1 family protein [Chitinophagaceae bacterium]